MKKRSFKLGFYFTLVVFAIMSASIVLIVPIMALTASRGYFAGIAVAEDVRGKGLGKILFYELCKGLREKGAAYMTLFTGENNPARNIYEEAGFRIVRSWSDMRRTT